jgi:hypothetical protein
MNQEEKFDRSIRNIIKNDIPDQPSSSFTDRVLEGLGIYRVQSKTPARPILSKWAKISIAAGYALILGLILIFSKGSTPPDTKYEELLSMFRLPSFNSLFQINGQVLTLLLVIIGGGWLLAAVDRVLKKLFVR